MDEYEREMKSPRGNSPRTIENDIRLAMRQSNRIVIDLGIMSSKTPSKTHVSRIKNRFNLSLSIKRILVVTKELLLLTKKNLFVRFFSVDCRD